MDWFELLELLAFRLDGLQISYFVTGSGATITYGEPRYTNDIDIVAELAPSDAERLCQAFPGPDFYVSRAAVDDAIHRRQMFNIIHIPSGLKIDVSVAKGTEFDLKRMERVVSLPRPDGLVVRFSSPEDVILKKMEFFQEGGSEKHLRDIAGVLTICQRPIDYAYIEAWATKLGVIEIWRVIQKRLADEKPSGEIDA
ncbi:MAG: hypothetical protein B7Z73_06215 [Planctomycetia bacterium 21-64-5]|nr:MAG: hypothetical protein B7Z73_06215 [Planctomycetia bacterium 21-64-5]HQU42034.1 hypothetical protein [Pirellulales bacterium]